MRRKEGRWVEIEGGRMRGGREGEGERGGEGREGERKREGERGEGEREKGREKGEKEGAQHNMIVALSNTDYVERVLTSISSKGISFSLSCIMACCVERL